MKYLRLIPVLLLGTILTACNTTKRLYETQEYDKVIQRVAPQICAGHLDTRQINYVAASYHKANQADHERIQALKATGQPDVWPEIYQRYCSMKGRNEALSCFPKQIKTGMNYVKLDLDDDLLAAQNKAESFLMAKADQLLGTGSKEDVVEAEKYVKQLRRTHPRTSQLLNLQKKCALYSAETVEFGFVSEYQLPEHFSHIVFLFDYGEIPVKSIRVVENPKHPFAEVVVNQVSISPIRFDEVTFKETKGDKTAVVTDYSQNKSVTVSGSIRYFANDREIPLGEVPFEVKSSFKNDYTVVSGDREACSAETLGRINTYPIPIPTDESMLIDAAKKLNDLLATELRK